MIGAKNFLEVKNFLGGKKIFKGVKKGNEQKKVIKKILPIHPKRR